MEENSNKQLDDKEVYNETTDDELELDQEEIYYEIKDDDGSYRFICSYSSFNEAKEKVDELEALCNNNLYRILRVEKNIEEVQ